MKTYCKSSITFWSSLPTHLPLLPSHLPLGVVSPLYEFSCVSSDVQTEKRIFHNGHRDIMISTLYVFLYVYLNVQTEKNIFTLVTENSLITGIWLIPCMHSHVLLQMFYTRKTILTLVTGIWFLPCMSFKCFRFPFCEKDSSY